MKIKILLLTLIVLSEMLLTGCWNYREIDKLSIVAGMAVDKGDTGKYDLSFEIVDLHQAGRETKILSKLLESTGDTLFDAIRNVVKFNESKMYFGHMEIVIIGQEVAKEGVFEVLDFLGRESEPRLNIDLLVSKEKTAREILSSNAITTEIRSYEINNLLDTQKELTKSVKVEVYQFINALPCEGVSPTLPAIHLRNTAGIRTSELSGNAVFKGDRLLGFLSEDETRYLGFILNKIKGGVLVMKSISDINNANVSLEIEENTTKVKPVYSNGNVSINIESKTIVAMDEQGSRQDLSTTSYKALVEKEVEDSLRANMEKLIHKVQKDYGVDIFGFGSLVNDDMPVLWGKIGSAWNDIFKDIKVTVKTKVVIRDTGLLQKPIKVGE